jgi:SnoaL-like protein
MTDVTTVIDSYIATWNEADPLRRRELVEETWSDRASYVDPLMSGEGRDGIDAMIGQAQQQFPAHRFELIDGPDAHHDRVRFTWRLVPAGGGEPVAFGFDFGTLAPDGRLEDVTGFLSVAP